MSALLLTLLTFLFAVPVHAEETAQTPATLFFTRDESAVIEDLVTQTKPEHADSTGIHLGAVMYYGPDDWTLWLQGQKWTPDTVHTDLQVVSVEANEVHISWHRNAQTAPQDIVLRPDQTYQIGSGKIVEGLK